MNTISKWIAFFVFASSIGFSASLTFQRISKVGPLQHKVIYASPKYKVKRINGQTKAFIKMIAMWGTQTYEVGLAEYNCFANNHCKYNQWISLSFYKTCVTKGKQAACRGRFSGGDNRHVNDYATQGFLETYEQEYYRESNSFGDYDFPERGQGYWEYPTTLF
ncbi:MAG: hypothetical protein JNL11_07585 [Bdellovibrionaceae bacterium]|nr:hypothetical protein [Pseudobdellovibrionaceae bacterium]